jgi:hypothetical protein
MPSSSDFIRLPFPSDLTQAGIAIASRRLASSSGPGKSIDFDTYRLYVAQTSVALAFQRYLLDQRVPFQIRENSPFTEPEQVTLLLGGRLCDVETRLITGENLFRKLSADPDRLLETSIQIPARLQSADQYHSSDLVLFAIAAARVTGDRKELVRTAESGDPLVCIHRLPEAWRQPDVRKALGQLSLRYAGDAPLLVDLYGLGLHQGLCTEQVSLQPQAWVESKYEYRSLSSLHAGAIPAARVEIRSKAHRHAYTIMPLQWRNLWLYGQEIILTGYLPFEEIRGFIRAAAAKWPGPSPTLEMPVTSLHSLPLFLAQLSARQ